MNTIRSLAIAAGLAVGLAGLTPAASAADPGTSFTYQGVLSQNGSPVNSMRDMRFRLYDAETGGNLVETIQKFGVEFDAGQFNVELDFNGAGPWAANQQLWLEIEAGPADGSQSYEVIGRQKLTAAPYALYTRGIAVDDLDRPTMRSPALRQANDPDASEGVWRAINSTSGGEFVLRKELDGNSLPSAVTIEEDNSITLGGTLSLENPVESTWSIFSGSQGRFGIQDTTGPNTRLLIDSAGNVGIGTTSPATLLHVRSNVGGQSDAQALFEANNCSTWCGQEPDTEAIRLTNRNGNGQVGIGFLLGASNVTDTPDLWLGSGLRAEGRANDFVFRQKDSGGTLRTNMYMDGDSRFVGIGTINPATTLDVNGAVTIRGGADIVEGFDSVCGTAFEPGTVLVIDAANPGMLTCAESAYDKKVAGVVSGAGGVQPGIKLGQDGVMDGDIPVAMTGRVYVKATASNGAIEPGDLLTTADLAGHAMKATDGDRLDGTVIGKAMGSLDSGEGLVLVLVNLQ